MYVVLFLINILIHLSFETKFVNNYLLNYERFMYVFEFSQDYMCGGAGKARNCRILKKLSYSVIIKIDPFCHIMHLKFLIYLK